jgi:integration host factor subunit alpha
MSLTRESLISSVHIHLNIPKKRSADLIESTFEIMKSTLASGEDVLISGFGKFCVRDKKERRGRNPQTGEEGIIGARRMVRFKCSGRLREKVDGKG